ncbi:MAG: IS5 family transposase, partial [Gemmatirosa sp.]
MIPERADQDRQRPHRPGRKRHFDRTPYRRRSGIGCTVGPLEKARAVATRCEKLATHDLALVPIGMFRLHVR